MCFLSNGINLTLTIDHLLKEDGKKYTVIKFIVMFLIFNLEPNTWYSSAFSMVLGTLALNLFSCLFTPFPQEGEQQYLCG